MLQFQYYLMIFKRKIARMVSIVIDIETYRRGKVWGHDCFNTANKIKDFFSQSQYGLITGSQTLL